jgi:hypothetical protein
MCTRVGQTIQKLFKIIQIKVANIKQNGQGKAYGCIIEEL